MKKFQLAIAALAAAATLGLTQPAPALADSAASTRNIILGAAALAGLAIESNVAHKNAQSRTISGYLPDGSRVYADGHIVESNGYSYYPQTNDQRVSCSNGSCYLASNGNFGDRSRYADNGQYGYNGQNSNDDAGRRHRDDGRP